MNFKTNANKLIARMLVLVLLSVPILCLTSCGGGLRSIDESFFSHKDWVKYIENYNSVHDLYLDTVLSFDLDNNDLVSKREYCYGDLVSGTAMGFYRDHGYFCDLYARGGIPEAYLFYLKSDGENTNEFAYKIKYEGRRVDFNYTADDKIEILISKCSAGSGAIITKYDEFYEDSWFSDSTEREKIYNYVYHYSVYVNDVEAGCIHISSIDEPSEEKLDEIIQMLYDSLVVINTEEFFIWRD